MVGQRRLIDGPPYTLLPTSKPITASVSCQTLALIGHTNQRVMGRSSDVLSPAPIHNDTP
jgi:hypothetical protein